MLFRSRSQGRGYIEAATIYPRPCDLDLLTLKVVSESRVTLATFVPILVFLGLSVLDLVPMYATDGFQSTRTLTKSYRANSYPSQLIPNTNSYPNHVVPNTNLYPTSLCTLQNVACTHASEKVNDFINTRKKIYAANAMADEQSLRNV